jgi:hypothetical protein
MLAGERSRLKADRDWLSGAQKKLEEAQKS